MKGKVAALAAGVLLGGAGSGLAVTKWQPAPVPRGHIATFVDLPDLECFNKPLNLAIPPVSPAGSVAVGCSANTNLNPSDVVVFTRDNRVFVIRSDTRTVVFRGRIG